MNPIGGVYGLLAQSGGDIAYGRFGFSPIERELAADEGIWIDITEM